jgi:hypothetical protein
MMKTLCLLLAFSCYAHCVAEPVTAAASGIRVVNTGEIAVTIAGDIKVIVVRDGERIIITTLRENKVESTAYYTATSVSRILEVKDTKSEKIMVLFDDNGDGIIDRQLPKP